MDIKEPLRFTTPRDWRAWLSLNHTREKETWLLITKKNSRQGGTSYNQALEEALCFGWIDGKMKSIDEDKFVLRFSPRKPKSIWSKMNKENTERLIASGRMTGAGLTVIEEAKKNGAWEGAYTNKVKDKVPADLETALSQNSAALTNFNNFANSYRNMYIGWVTSSKTKATRQKRIAEVVKKSLLNKKLITD